MVEGLRHLAATSSNVKQFGVPWRWCMMNHFVSDNHAEIARCEGLCRFDGCRGNPLKALAKGSAGD